MLINPLRQFKQHLHGVSDAGTRHLLLKFRLGMHGLGIDVEKANWNVLCVVLRMRAMVHVLWECSAYSSRRAIVLW